MTGLVIKLRFGIVCLSDNMEVEVNRKQLLPVYVLMTFMVEMKFIILKLIGVDMSLIWMEKKIKTSSQYWVDIGLVIFVTHHFIMTPCFTGKVLHGKVHLKHSAPLTGNQ